MPRRVWALADTHLSFAKPKPMDIFGPQWKDHPERILENCRKLVGDKDLLLIPGDLSWAMRPAVAEPDLAFLASLPGIKVVCKGNHDYWWDSDKPLRFPGLHDTPFVLGEAGIGVAGTRGWTPAVAAQSPEERASDEKIIARECRRLKKRLAALEGCEHKFAMIHYPPLPDFVPLLLEAGVEAIVYGHLHVGSADAPLPELWHGIRCLCVAADCIAFTPCLVASIDA